MSLLFCLQKGDNLRSIEQLQSSKSHRVLGLFGNILRNKYPDSKEQIPFNELLDWQLWPGFLGIIGTYSEEEYYINSYRDVCGSISGLTLIYSESLS